MSIEGPVVESLLSVCLDIVPKAQLLKRSAGLLHLVGDKAHVNSTNLVILTPANV